MREIRERFKEKDVSLRVGYRLLDDPEVTAKERVTMTRQDIWNSTQCRFT
jgi:hypothetical protein